MPNKFLIVCGGSGIGLLGQRSVLAIDGELQIDVRKEINRPEREADDHSMYIELDLPVGTTPMLLADIKDRIKDGLITDEADVGHASFLCDYWPGDEPLQDGLAASPAIGGATIRHDTNKRKLEGALRTIVNEWAQNIGPQNPLEVWIISSTSGGTGEGIHRFLAERLVNLLTTIPRGATVVINFVRVGPLTYRPIEERRVPLNTFFAIAADAALKIGLPRQYAGRVGVTTRWYYVEIPYVGKGPGAIPVRARLIEMATKAIMIDELQDAMKGIVVNDGVGLVRAGFWGCDFHEQVKYYETLKSLVVKLEGLINPDDTEFVTGRAEPEFVKKDHLESILRQLADTSFLSDKIQDENWKFKYYHRKDQTPEELLGTVREWRNSINKLIAPAKSIDNISSEYQVERTIESNGEKEIRKVALSVPSFGLGLDWFEAVRECQASLAWCSHLLGEKTSTKGVISKLYENARECSHAFRFSLMADSQKRAEELVNHLPRFVENLAQVITLLELRRRAKNRLDGQLIRPRQVLEFAKKQLKTSELESVESSPVIAAELWDMLDRVQGRRWLDLLTRSVERNDAKGFRLEVLRGATGLTRSGLLKVLQLDSSADDSDIRSELRQRVGRMRDEDGNEFEAQWWNADPPPSRPDADFKYRVLPKLERQLQLDLGEGDGKISYQYAELGAIGLSVLGVEAVGIAEKNNLIATPTYLLKSVVPIVKEVLKDWGKPVYGRPCGKLLITGAGVVGEPLFKPAMEEAGLTTMEMEKIAEFYQLYDPQDEVQTESQEVTA